MIEALLVICEIINKMDCDCMACLRAKRTLEHIPKPEQKVGRAWHGTDPKPIVIVDNDQFLTKHAEFQTTRKECRTISHRPLNDSNIQ